jgi:hypothetical protein
MAFLYKAGTPEQRAISLIMTFVTFIFSAVASAAHLYMTASGNMAQDAATLSTLRNVAMLAVVAGVVLNFGAWLLYTRYSAESKERVRQSDRRDAVMRAEEHQADYLDKLIVQKTKTKLEGEADRLADLKAGRIADSFVRRETAQGYDAARKLVPAVASHGSDQPQLPPAPDGGDAPERPFSLPPRVVNDREGKTARPFLERRRATLTQRVKSDQGE